MSESTIRRLVARRELAGHRIGRRILRIDLDELDHVFTSSNGCPTDPEYGLQLPSGRVIVGPGWKCEGDVLAASYGHGTRPGGDLVVREERGPWRVVRRLQEDALR